MKYMPMYLSISINQSITIYQPIDLSTYRSMTTHLGVDPPLDAAEEVEGVVDLVIELVELGAKGWGV